MQNINLELKGDILVITIDLTKEFGKSKSGKSNIIATTAGNISIPNHSDLHLGLNLYRK